MHSREEKKSKLFQAALLRAFSELSFLGQLIADPFSMLHAACDKKVTFEKGMRRDLLWRYDGT